MLMADGKIYGRENDLIGMWWEYCYSDPIQTLHEVTAWLRQLH